MRTREAIVLAGGLGTRLHEMLPGIPKCMAMVNGKPFLTYVLDYLIEQDIDKVILSVGYLKDHIINYFGDNYQSLEIEYAIENELLGTGGAIKLSFGFCKQDVAFVINGDTCFFPDLKAMEDLHLLTSADITIAAKQMTDTIRYGLIQTDHSGRITDFREKHPVSGKGLINGGIYMINRKIVETFPQQKFSLENEVFKKLCSEYKMQAFQSDAFFLDMGIPEDYMKAQAMIPLSGKL
jgi:D-glycero-alpha-D-manno-heptose 1-phosphate guanylyltransferase